MRRISLHVIIFYIMTFTEEKTNWFKCLISLLQYSGHVAAIDLLCVEKSLAAAALECLPQSPYCNDEFSV